MRRHATRLLAIGSALLLATAAHGQGAASGETPAEPEAGKAAQGGETSAKPPEPEEPAMAGKPPAELIAMVESELKQERAGNLARLEEFRKERVEQERALAAARVTAEREEATSRGLETMYGDNEVAIEKGEERLKEQLGQLGELFGVVRQVATDTSAQAWESLTSAELGGRKDLLDRLGRSTELPSTEDLEELWYELQREMIEQGQVSRFTATILNREGKLEEREVVRAGPFNAISDGRYLLWKAPEQKLLELPRQPPPRYLRTAKPFEEATTGFARLSVDPSQGALLKALTETPSLWERVQQGGAVGYVIIGLGVSAVLLGLARWSVIFLVGRRVAAQKKRDTSDPGNPLGRVRGIYEANRESDPEALELKLDDMVMRETANLERFLWLVQVVSVVTPLLGLLGTVTGMIQTFQAITLFGSGDPKMMAGGISEALITTMLGLVTAIPLVLLHAKISSSARQITEVLDEESAGLVAIRAENAHAGG